MASIRRRVTRDGRIRYQAEVRLKGHPKIYETFHSNGAARDWARRVESELISGHFTPRIEAERRTLAEAIDRYLEDCLGELSTSYQRNVRSYLKWWRQQLGDLSLAGLTPAVIVDARRGLAAGKSPATTNRYLATLSAVLDRCDREWEWLDANPCRRIRSLRESGGRVRFLSDDERDRLLEACRESGERRLYPLVLFAIATGARQGELLGLRWQDVDLAARRATLHDTKNRDRRSIAFPGAAGELLVELSRTPHISGWVFGYTGARPTFPRKAWLEALTAAEINDFRFHDLRHTAASYLAMSGATLAEIAEVLGHRTLAMVKRYAHLSEAHSEAVVGRMAERFLS